MNYIWKDPERVGQWMTERGNGPKPGMFVALGFEVDGELKFGISFDNYAERTVMVHCVTTKGRFLTRGILRQIYSYVFKQLDCTHMIGRISEDNVIARKAAEHIGFRLKGTFEHPAGRYAEYHLSRADFNWS